MRRAALFLLWIGLATPAHALQVYEDHPRVFVRDSDLPLLRARCGIRDGDNQTTFAAQWNSHAAEYQALIQAIAAYPPEYTPDPDHEWTRDVVRAHDDHLAFIATAYLLNAHRAEGNTYEAILTDWWERLVQYAKNQNGGVIDQCISSNYMGKNAVWKGFTMAYDYAFDMLPPPLRDDAAEWLYANSKDGFYYIGGLSSAGPEEWSHYYKRPWLADVVFTTTLATWGDPGVADHASEYPHMLDYTHRYKMLDNEARAKNYCGTYAGYRWERPEEDVSSALVWKSATVGEDPFLTYGYHYRQLDDWVMYMSRANFTESDETGHSADLAGLRPPYIVFNYPAACMDRQAETLWFLDRVSEEEDTISLPWFKIFFNDKSIARQRPTHTTTPLARYFGDMTPEDGYNSQYTHMRSGWNFSTSDASTVMASYMCGPWLPGHDVLSNGHLAIFRGTDILTASVGVFDGGDQRHSLFYHEAPISENTILVVDPNNPYVEYPSGDAPLDSLGAVLNEEGMQVEPPSGVEALAPDDPFSYRNEIGFITRFKNTDEFDTYLHANITSAYPNTLKPDLWPEGGTVENVSRQVVFEVGKYFVLCDRVTSTNPAAEKAVLMHIPSKDGYTLLDGAWNGGVAPHPIEHGGTPGQTSDNALRYRWTYGGSAAFATVLYPEPVSRGGEGRKLRRIGGANSLGEWNKGGSNPSFEFWMTQRGENPTWIDRYVNSTELHNYYELGWAGMWRMEIVTTGRKDDTFLHVYEITSTGQAAPTVVDYLDNIQEGRVACIVRHPGNPRINVFSRDEELDTEAFYGALSDEPIIHNVADLAPGTYDVRDELSSFSAMVVVDESSLATFRSPGGGRFRLTRLDGESLARLTPPARR